MDRTDNSVYREMTPTEIRIDEMHRMEQALGDLPNHGFGVFDYIRLRLRELEPDPIESHVVSGDTVEEIRRIVRHTEATRLATKLIDLASEIVRE